MVSRRDFLKGGLAALALGAAGCSSNGDDPNPPLPPPNATEAEAETEIIAKLGSLKTGGSITDYFGPNYTVTTSSGDTIVDALVLTSNFKAISYLGENDTLNTGANPDTNITLQKQWLNADYIPYIDIRPMPVSRIQAEVGNAEAAGWVDQTLVEKTGGLEQKINSSGTVAMAGLGVGAAALAAIDTNKEESRRGLFKGLLKWLGVAGLAALGIGLAARKVTAENDDEEMYRGYDDGYLDEKGRLISHNVFSKERRITREERRFFSYDNAAGEYSKVHDNAETTYFNKFNEVSRIEDTVVQGNTYKTRIFRMKEDFSGREEFGSEEGIVENGKLKRQMTSYANIRQEDGKLYNLTVNHKNKAIDWKRAA